MNSHGSTSMPGAERDDLDLRLQAFIERGPEPVQAHGTGQSPEEAEFNALALELFAYQFERNNPYQRFCRTRGAQPGVVAKWQDIPAVPLTAFKELTLACAPAEDSAAVFMTSGSTDPSTRGRNHHPHLHLYDASAREGFAHYFLPDTRRMPLLVLNPGPTENPNSSLAHFLGELVDAFGATGSDHFMAGDTLDWKRLATVLRDAEASGEPVALLGTSFAYVHLLDALEREGLFFSLPAGSRLLDTGGYKGRSREVGAEELRSLFAQRLGIADEWCVNYYGMTEISTQYYDSTLREAWLGREPGQRRKAVPAWSRIRVIDPQTGRDAEPGSHGLIVHYDLANRGSCLAVFAEDIGYLVPPATGGADAQPDFVLLGRAEAAEARGCSMALDEMLGANRG